jgi:hypothetical protein
VVYLHGGVVLVDLELVGLDDGRELGLEAADHHHVGDAAQQLAGKVHVILCWYMGGRSKEEKGEERDKAEKGLPIE